MRILFRASTLHLACATASMAGVSVAAAVAPSPMVAAPRLTPPRLVAPAPMRPTPPGDPAPVDWREANREVERLGGHAGHLRTSPGERAVGATAADPPRGAGR